MALTRRLLKLVVGESVGNPDLEKAMQYVLETDMKLNLASPTKTRTSLFDRVKGSRFGRPDYIRVLKKHGLLIDLLIQAALPDEQNALNDTKKMWSQMVQLLALASSPAVTVTEKFWLEKARAFGTLFGKVYAKEAVTSYLHLFVYHLGFFLEKYGGIEMLANYGIEGMHAVNKRVISRATNGLSRNMVTYQQLAHGYRLERYKGRDVHDQERKQYKSKQSWSDALLELQGELSRFVPENN